MPRVAPMPPEDSAILCEGCGYIIDGIPGDSRCPECAKPIAESRPDLRTVPPWEDPAAGKPFERFWRTTADTLVRPTRFYRSLATRTDTRPSRSFARIHMLFASVLLGLAAYFHLMWMLGLPSIQSFGNWLYTRQPQATQTLTWIVLLAGPPVLITFTYLALAGTTRLGAWLTAWEANYRGLRLPLPVVLRALDYHAPHYLPPAILGFLTVLGYQSLVATNVLTEMAGPRYLYVLAAEILLAAGYLFKTYWTGMRNVMFANR